MPLTNSKNKGQPRVCLKRWTNTRTHDDLEWLKPLECNPTILVSYIAESLTMYETGWSLRDASEGVQV